tara:strand:- start:111 stop:728 length:618 start_codon:yes stop_codon:yes gene_type:complete
MPIKESCVSSLEHAIHAEKHGADRIELCKNLDLDGLTPNKKVIINTIRSLSIPVKVMIRPRSGDFIYNENEIKVMEKNIDFCKKLNVFGVVFGVLTEKKTIDIKKTKRLAYRSYPMDVTIHKAIDQSKNILNELERLSKIDAISSVLTSGGEKNAFDGQIIIREIIKRYGVRFKIIVAGSITYQNYDKIHHLINAKEYHGQKIIK